MEKTGSMEDQLGTVRRYHEATKHHPQRYARSLGWLDWANQPDPFRRYAGAPVRRLPLPAVGPATGPTWDELRAGVRTGSPAPAPVNAVSLGDFFYHSLALSAWKQVTGPDGKVVSRWALRVNPSSGNLHPTEAWLVDGEGVHHYAPDLHALELRGAWGADGFQPARCGLPAGSFLVGIASIPWREAWKYGERAFRYCQHDAGHALAALGLAAARLGWTARRLEGVGTAELSALLGLDPQAGPEFEHADALVAVAPGPWEGGALTARPPVPARWFGQASPLSEDHHPWPVIAEMAAAVAAPAAEAWEAPVAGTCAGASFGGAAAPDRHLDAATLIRGRRSAVAMDGRTAMAAPAFFRLLASLMPARDDPALRTVGADVDVSLVLLVHRVTDLMPGLYVLCRAPGHEPDLREALRADFVWERPPGCPEALPLFRLGTGDLREAARQVSCTQAIAADGAFSLGLLARFEPALAARGPSAWPRLFQETGAVGQLLYLEAEAAGLRGTGIGCFFDDEVHRAIGLVDRRWQSLYHFTVGGPVDDTRLQTAPAYPAAPEGEGDDHR
jgi:SagB-type dehydrogenase family enzyme